ncbi:CRAL/TRIO domain-containing protein [Phanerochaete sordida]|uniref:CRAL/TRIO domain-containing protein n=1 Tax=Phanerochaete sordida TaxID=48140 RepID=A0A9P3GSY8_9APHY|nr:CRAL/TRIO domain-containing protein [Phanerochaete sordida]
MSETIVATQAAPVPSLATAKPAGEGLTPAQQKLAADVLAHFAREDYALPVKEGEKALTDEEKFWLTYECILRYCRATKWGTAQQTVKRLEETLQWRREFGLYDERFTPEHVEPEALTGKIVAYGFDVDGRPALYLCPSRQNTEESPRQVEFTVFMLERCIDLMGPGVESIALMVDYGQKSPKSPSLGMARTVLNILQSHYPERLGRALIINVPWVLNAFYKLITPLIDPVTRDKMRFNPKTVQDGLFAAPAVWAAFGGAVDFRYDHAAYWPHLVALAAARRAAQMARWRELGGKVGVREWEIRQGEEPVVEEKPAEAAAAAEKASS